MTTANDERLEAIRRELERQNQEWEGLQERLMQLGDVPLEVPSHVVDQIAGPNPQPAAPFQGVRV